MLIEGCMYVYVDLCGFMALVGYIESECPALSGIYFVYVCVCVCVCVCVPLCSYCETRAVMHQLLSMSDGQV